MKLLRAHFTNFRLLRDLELNFSCDPERTLTVIRAENETGKTTILTALQWAFYGDEALPGDPKSYRLHPIDWSDERAVVKVEVDFEADVPARGGGTPARTTYRIVRTATDELKGSDFRRVATDLHMYEITPNGARAVDYAENKVRTELPIDLREVFFTDGDRALSFIEADSATVKRRRVENAIKSLLGLTIVEDAAKHVKQAGAEVNKKVRESGAGKTARDASKRIEALDEKIGTLEADRAEALANRGRCEVQYELLSKKIEAILEKGNRHELVTELHKIRAQTKRDESLALALAKEQGELLKGRSIAKGLLAPYVTKASSLLEGLREKGRIPSQTIPVLVERLSQPTCICGESLQDGTENSTKRRTHIEHLVESSRKADSTQKLITELYYSAQELISGDSGDEWKMQYLDICDRRQKIEQNLQDLGARQAQLEAKIDSIPDVDIQSIRDQKKIARDHQEEHANAALRAQISIDIASNEKRQAEEERDKALKQEGHNSQLMAELTVSQDLLRVFEGALERLKSEELVRVSRLMNEIFLDMIGSDVEQGAIIQRAEISDEFDILVYGPGDRTLNPDRDLNGASRRALTLAFILALTRVSDVEAPNIIDTPLGMMSGFVKSSVVQSAVAHSAQLILFLTRSEIHGIEDLLSKYAGVVLTLTNPAHYPKMLLHEPPSRDIQVVRCECNHEGQCSVCARHMTAFAQQAIEAEETV